MRYVHKDYSTLVQFLQFLKEPWFLRSIARTVCLDDERPQVLHAYHRLHILLLYAWEKCQYEDARLHGIVRSEGNTWFGAADVQSVVLDVYTRLCQGRIVVRTEGIEPFCIYLGGTVATHQHAFKEYAHLRHHRFPCRIAGSGYLYGRKQILLSVRAQLAYGQLCPRYHHRLGNILQHETQGRSRESHSVRAM